MWAKGRRARATRRPHRRGARVCAVVMFRGIEGKAGTYSGNICINRCPGFILHYCVLVRDKCLAGRQEGRERSSRFARFHLRNRVQFHARGGTLGLLMADMSCPMHAGSLAFGWFCMHAAHKIGEWPDESSRTSQRRRPSARRSKRRSWPT